MTFYWCEEFLPAKFKYEPVIEDGILALGEKMLVVGPSEAGKSYLLLQLAFELATGGAFFGRAITRPYRTLLVQSEVLEGEYQKRTQKLIQSYKDLPPKQLAFATTETMKLNEGQGLGTLGEMMEETQPEVLMLDPLRAFFAGDENSSDVSESFFTAISLLYKKVPPFSLIIAHHVRKPSLDWSQDGSGKYDTRGSGMWTDRPSTVLGLTMNAQQTQWQLQYLKTRGRTKRPPSQELFVDWDTGLFDVTDDSVYGVGCQVIEETLAAGELPLETLLETLHQAKNVSKRTVMRWLFEAEQSGSVERYRDPEHKSRKLVHLKERHE